MVKEERRKVRRDAERKKVWQAGRTCRRED